MQDEDKFRERIQIMLDNRQIFLIFLACSVILALVFSLGLVVGKRMSTQSVAPPPSDPLAMLDKLSASETDEESLTFHEALTAGEALKDPFIQKGKRSGETPDEAAKPSGEDKAAAEARAKEVKAKEAAEAKAAQDKAKEAKAKKAAEANQSVAGQGEGGLSESKQASGDYTLQLSSFQDKQEAEQFKAKLVSSGHKPYIQPASIPGKGLWFRVRLGSFPSWDEAMAAKQKFEAKYQIIAYVMRK